MIKEFKKFIFRGNIIDLSIGVIIGGAFTGIVNSLVNDVIMPFLGVLTSGINFKDIKIDLSGLSKLIGNTVPEKGVYISIGLFMNALVQFIIMALVIFMFIKIVNGITSKKENEEKKEEVKPTPKAEDIVLLEKILKELKTQKK